MMTKNNTINTTSRPSEKQSDIDEEVDVRRLVAGSPITMVLAATVLAVLLLVGLEGMDSIES